MKNYIKVLAVVMVLNYITTVGNTVLIKRLDKNDDVQSVITNEESFTVETEVTCATETSEEVVTETTTVLFDETKEMESALEEYRSWTEIVDMIDSPTQLLEVPNEDTSFKSYMNYGTITNTTSQQYKMQQSAWTDEYGLRRYGDAYMVALGTFYAAECGEYFKVTLENGSDFTVVTGDIKADSHTDDRNMYSPIYEHNVLRYANIVEFIVDTTKMPENVKKSGNIGTLKQFAGQIVSIERVSEDEYLVMEDKV